MDKGNQMSSNEGLTITGGKLNWLIEIWLAHNLLSICPLLYLIYIQTFFIGIVPTKAITGTIPGNEEGVSGPGKLLFINTVSVLYF